mmetsp:Transcript_1020/g.1724  ORF Transcript_1020/g.1724 Transcript_1020/m.1724 type:complete len:109 (-) Transcript_1020:298-624(-)|eukprot:CAMPEP_0171548910 /NCGR_PEP_ID=MMETSP0960-20121227/6125_1 /TAXON_ID=87120 /ORGANISM="Aurantiochytrium limacinum, Strain ATCCMYA-1381" /LENGTH=108 /DNA_ID=CAMNT_0012097495 /DNA_START=105 /DNA_END=431 /DNA_ORIENTATION=+
MSLPEGFFDAGVAAVAEDVSEGMEKNENELKVNENEERPAKKTSLQDSSSDLETDAKRRRVASEEDEGQGDDDDDALAEIMVRLAPQMKRGSIGNGKRKELSECQQGL